MDSKEIITKSSQEMKKVGRVLAQEILSGNNKNVLVIGLEGDLGSGKTTFVQGLAKGLGIKDKITSPTFVIIKKYSFLYHIDCYRIKDKDLLELDFNEIIKTPGNLIIIEWAERVKKILPKDTLWMKFEYLDKNKRRIIYENPSSN